MDELEILIVAGANDDDIEDAILFNILGNERDNHEHHHFRLADIPESECKFLFRFEKDDIYRLSEALHLPEFITTRKQNKVTGVTGLCMLLRRLAYPNRLKDLELLFGYSPSSLSMIISETLEIILNNYGHLLNNIGNLQWLNQQHMEMYAQAIRDKGGAIPNCWAFIDGTARAICRPSVDQETYYSGHKRFHCIKYQSVLSPDGIIVSLKGGWPGRRHDAAIFAESNIYEELERNAVFPDGNRYVLFGDQAYGIRELLLTPFPNRPNINILQQQFNASMKPLRLTVEWGFQKVIGEFAFLDFKKNQKLLLQDLESFYKVGVLLSNCHTCLYSSQTAQYFNVNPPGLEEYLGL